MSPFRKAAAMLLFCFFAATGVQAAEVNVNKIVAVVNGEMVTLHELRMHTAAELSRRRMRPDDPKTAEVQREVLDSIVNDILIRQEAKRYKVSVTPAEVDAEYKRAMTRSGRPPEKFEAELKEQGVSVEMFKARVHDNLLRQRMAGYMVARKVFVTPEEIADYYAKHPAEFAGEKTADFSIMILPENVNAPDIYKKLQNGALVFEDVAREHSLDNSRQEGGRVAGVPWDRMMPQMQKILSSLQDGKYSPLMRTKGGFVIIRRNGVHDAKPLTLQEATPKIEEILRTPLLEERFKEFTSQLRSKAVIDIRL